MDEVARQGVTSFKMFMAYRVAVIVDDDTIFKAMVRAVENRTNETLWDCVGN